jgi:hypothetical protein
LSLNYQNQTRTFQHGEWESESDPEEDGLRYDEELETDENEIQPDEGENNCFISLRVLSVTAMKERIGSDTISSMLEV